MTDGTLPEGYYAVPDPADSGLMTYWRVRDGQVTSWPPRAKYGPQPLRSLLPPGLSEQDRRAWAWNWRDTVYLPWHAKIRALIAAGHTECGARFAALVTRCCMCGKRLTDAASKTYGIGPDCRAGLPAEWLDAIAHAVGRAHAAAGGTA